MPSHGGKKAPLQRTGGLIIAILVDTWQRSKGMVQKRKLGNSAARKGPNRHLAWLNDPAKDAARERIRALFRDLRVVSSNWHTLSKDAAIQRIPALSGGWSFVSGSWHPDFDPHTRADFGEFRGDKRSFASASKRIVATLRRYKFSPQAIITSGLFLVWVPYSGPDGRYRRPWPSYSDARAVLDFFGIVGAMPTALWSATAENGSTRNSSTKNTAARSAERRRFGQPRSGKNIDEA